MANTVESKFYNSEEDITVTLKTQDGNDYDYVIIGDADKVSDRTLMQMTSGVAPKGWTRKEGE
jgi:hypothetical protein